MLGHEVKSKPSQRGKWERYAQAKGEAPVGLVRKVVENGGGGGASGLGKRPGARGTKLA